jgi:hypothetical protein
VQHGEKTEKRGWGRGGEERNVGQGGETAGRGRGKKLKGMWWRAVKTAEEAEGRG